jgi:anion-transporting  ArsA/GET3 family ATPase
MFGGFRARAQQTFALLQQPGTAFVVVAAPEPDALREAAFFVERLAGENMPLAGLVVNRASRLGFESLSGEQALAAAERLEAAGDDATAVTAGLLRLHADRSRIVARERHLRQRFTAAHPHVPTAVVPALSTDVHDLDGLRQVGALLAG